MKIVKTRDRSAIDPIEWQPYEGETVIVRTVIRGGKKIQETAFYEDKVKAIPKGNAYIIGNGPSRKGFDLNLLKDSGQIYGCNALYRDFRPDFLFSVDTKMTTEISESKIWQEGVICYAPSLEVNRSEGLHLIPKNPHYTSGNQAIWTATVHGHKKLYLIGFDYREYGQGKTNNIYQDTKNYGPRHSETVFSEWLSQLRRMIKQRPYCTFTIIHDDPPEYFRHLQTGSDLQNTGLMSYDDFKDKVLGQTA